MSKTKVLVVDDQPGIRRLLLEVFTDEGYEVSVATNGNEALEKATEIKPAVILMDMKMPGMDGIDALKELKELGLAERVIMMTAYGELELVTKAKELGAFAYVTKPFDIIKLCEMVSSYIAGNKDNLMIG
ncbi:MAG: response regulator receiver protein [Firmicutes bacterium]|nr:response regulator receiver protein [Bacillota bacterium]